MTEYTKQSIALCQRILNVEAGANLIIDGIIGDRTRDVVYGAGFSTVAGVNWHYAKVRTAANSDPAWERRAEALGIREPHPESAPVPGVKGDFIPIGVMLHHTGGPPGRKRVPFKLFAKGTERLSGPIVQFTTSREGSAQCITNGRAHHAGKGDGRVLGAICNGSPLPIPGRNDTQGNTLFYGIECDHTGDSAEGVPPSQWKRNIEVAAMWCQAWRWDPYTRCIGHRQWTSRKVDPVFYSSMGTFAAEVAGQISEWKKAEEATVAAKVPLAQQFACPHCDKLIFATKGEA